MFRKLVNTSDNPAITILRLVLGVVFFAHGAQKALGWFGGYGFSGTMGFFTQQAHIPAAFAFLEYHLLAIAMALAIMIKGSGALSADRALSK